MPSTTSPVTRPDGLRCPPRRRRSSDATGLGLQEYDAQSLDAETAALVRTGMRNVTGAIVRDQLVVVDRSGEVTCSATPRALARLRSDSA